METQKKHGIRIASTHLLRQRDQIGVLLVSATLHLQLLRLGLEILGMGRVLAHEGRVLLLAGILRELDHGARWLALLERLRVRLQIAGYFRVRIKGIPLANKL